ncbi:MAG TPA: glycosyltransferase family 4 protein [Kiritimatiellia bacterium]|nr:glycosyltransferase family 4 protein [Kiritimatiellia bacterium]
MLRSEDEAMQGKPASLIPYPVSRIPYRVSRIPPLVLRLTAPNAHDPWGGIQAADAVIASGTSIDKVRKALRPDVHNVPNGVHLETFAGSETLRDQARQFRERWQIPVAAPVLLYVARFQDFKKHDMLIRSFSLVVKKKPEVRLVLAGSGPLRSELEKQVKAAGLRDQVIMLGEVGFDQLPSIYTAADIKVISSEYESFCFAAVEAMASGLPVVTTDCGWVPGLIGDVLPPIDKQWASGGDAPGRFEVEQDGKRIRQASGGLVVSRTEPVSLTTALLHMIGDAELRKSCGRWNREKAVREHGWESSAKKLLHVYESLLDGEDSYEPRMDGHGWGAG